jgi:hypothetical protein
MVPSPVKPPRAVLASLVVLAAGALALGASLAWRERTRPARELAALERARAAADELAARPAPFLDALASRAHEDFFPSDALPVPGLQDWGILSLDKKERPVVWHRESIVSPELDAIVRAMRGEETRGELATLGLKNPPASFDKVWSHGVENGVARMTVIVGRRRGTRVIVAIAGVAVKVDD